MFLLALPALILILYSNAEHAPFAFDDRIHILENPFVRSFQSTLDVAAIRQLIRNPSGLASRPLLLATYGLNYAASGTDAAAFRRDNWIIHIANTLLVFLIAFEIAGNAGVSGRRFQTGLIAAAVFAAHPMLTESVTYVTGRSSSLCALLYFAGLYSTLRSARSQSLRWLLLVLTIACSFVGLLVKQEAITLPAAGIALVWIAWPDALSVRRRWAATALLVCGGLLILAIQYRPLADASTTTQNNYELLAAGFESTLPFTPYFLTAITAYCSYYLWRFVLPVQLSVDPDVATVTTPISIGFLISVLVIGALVYAALRFRKSRLMLSSGIALVLISPLSAYCVFPLPDVIAEHRAYISVLGAVLILADIVSTLPGAAWASLALLALYGWLTVERNAVWNNEVVLWEDASKKAPDKIRPHLNLGALYQSLGQSDRAIREYNFVLERDPDHSAAAANLAALYMAANESQKAEELLNNAIARKTAFPTVYLNLGVMRLRQGRLDEAQELMRHALKLNSSQLMIHLNLGDILFNQGQPSKAIDEYLAEIRLNPDSVLAHLHLAKAYEVVGSRAKAIEEYAIVRRLDPGNRDAQDALERLT